MDCFRLNFFQTLHCFRESKNALLQLITHTKNVERAITMNQQDVQIKKDMDAQK
jgi:hypothetical protein